MSSSKSLIPPFPAHLEDHLSNKVNASNLKNSDIHGSVYPPLVSAHCSRCLGLGHTRKLCKGSIRCKSCFNYGHLSYTCLSKGRQRHYRPITKSDVGRPRPAPLNATTSSSSKHSEKLTPSPSHAIVRNLPLENNNCQLPMRSLPPRAARLLPRGSLLRLPL